MTTATHNYGWLMPDPGGSANTWGNTLNGTTQAIDAQVWSITNAPVAFNAPVTFNGTVGLASTLYVAGVASFGSDIGASGTVTGAQITSTANMYAPGTITAGYLTAGSTVTGAQITSTGNMNVSGTGTFGNINASGTVTTGNVIVQNGLLIKPGDNGVTANAGGQYVMINGSTGFGGGSSFILNGGQRSSAFEWYWGSSQIANMGGDGSFYIQGTVGQKLSGTTWANPSDARIKNVIGDYTAGLAEVLQLNPVTFTFKDNYTREAGGASPHATLAKDRTPCVGLIAQEVEAVFPEMVTKGEGYIDGRRVSDFRNLDTSNLILALVNSVKELKAEIEALKASR
jgi:Chaperone of endosialidase